MDDPMSTGSVYGAIGVVVGGAIITVATFVWNLLKGKAEGAQDVHGRHVILEQAELRDFGDLPKELRAIAGRMDQVFMAIDPIDDMRKDLSESLTILRRMDREMEISRRLREEQRSLK